MISKETDTAAEAAWNDRMWDVRNSCRKTIESLSKHGLLAEPWQVKSATDVLWTLLSVANFEQLTVDCGWSTKKYVDHMQRTARRAFLKA